MKKFLFLPFILLLATSAFAAGGTCPSGNVTIDSNGNPITLASLGVTTCFYVSKSTGADTNAGTTEGSPWAHLPGMPSCTNTCNSTTPAAGEGFILRGGETWTSSDLGVNWQWSGSSGSWIYVGIDPTWFNSSNCGGSWCRPIWDGGKTTLSGAGSMFQAFQSWVMLDNIEWKGMLNSENGCYNNFVGNLRCTRFYAHGWAHTGSSNNVGFLAEGGTGSMADHFVIDGSDSLSPNGTGSCPSGSRCGTMNGVFGQWSNVQYAYIGSVVSGVLATTYSVHDVMVELTVDSVDGDHCNAIFTFDVMTNNTQLIYNNVVRHTNPPDFCQQIWFNGNGNPNSSIVGYGFNNVMYDLGTNPVDIGNHGAGNYGTYHWFNNTVDCATGAGSCGGSPPSGPFWTIYDQNNHLIGSALNFSCSGCTVPVCSVGSGSGCTDLTQSLSTANGQGYTNAETFAYSPANSNGSTVAHGTNVQSYCTALSSIDANAETACKSSTGYACSYNTTNHTLLCPNDTLLIRPASGAWDIGAYEFGGTSYASTPTFTPSTAAFGPTPLRSQSQPISITMQNNGSVTYTASSWALNNNRYFIQANTCGTPSSFTFGTTATSFSLAASATCTFQVVYTPLAVNPVDAGGVNFIDNTSGGSTPLSFSGNGFKSPVNLSQFQ